MKKLIALLFAVTTIFSVAQAQTDPKAKAILAEVSKKYRSYNTIKADFSFGVENKQNNLKQTEKGTLYAKSNSKKYKVTMAERDLISDGKVQWTYLKNEEEVQVGDADNTEDALNPANVFTIFEKGFKYIYNGEKKVGSKVYQMIDLAPLDTKKAYFKIRLSVDKAAKQLASVMIFDKNSSIYTYTITAFTPNAKVPESTFTFNPKSHPGVEIVDLR
jgi:outer membrane lipoprotein-sorting protein